MLNGLYDAKLDGQPVLAITGLQHHDLLNTMTQQDVELDKLFEDVAVYNNRIMGPAHTENVVELACRTALAYRGVAHVTMPVDFQSQSVSSDTRSKRNVKHHVSSAIGESAPLPAEDQLAAAAETLNAGSKIVILAGRGAIGCGHELQSMAERLGRRWSSRWSARGHCRTSAPIRPVASACSAPAPSQEAMESCDPLLIVGSSFPYIEFYPKPGNARAVQIDIDPKRLGLRYPVEVLLVGDACRVLRNLLPRLDYHTDRSFLTRAQEGMAKWRELLEERGTRTEIPMKPQVVAHELNKLLADDAIITTDSGTITTWVARHIDIRGTMMFSCSGNLAQVVAFIGDGGLSMLMCELATAVKYKLGTKVIVIKNNTLGQIKWEQMVFLGNPEYGCELEPIDFLTVACGFGAHAFHIEDPSTCGDILNQALATPGPVVVEAVVDPHEQPKPPKVSLSEAAKFAEALVHGTPHAGKIALTVVSEKVRELI